MITSHYCYMELVQVPREATPRYFTPLGDPMEFESAFDNIFDTPEGAAAHLQECLDEELYGGDLAKIRDALVLVKVTVEPV